MARRVEAIVKLELLVWARKKAGFDVETAAKKANLSADRLAAWEQGQGRPTIAQLRELGRVYKRPIAVFYLPEPPRDFPPIKDYRVAWDQGRKAPTPELLAEIKSAYERREVALELLDLDLLPTFTVRANLDESPDAVADRLRGALAVSLDAQLAWRDTREGFNTWRAAAEAMGVLVFQMTSVEQGEARGFSIDTRPLPVVVANNRDPFGARSFTVIHELAHVAISESGICDLDNRGGRVEPFCNHVAGAVLVPADALLAEDVVRNHGTDAIWHDDELASLAHCYAVSREVVLRRLLMLGRTDETFYRRKRREFLAEYQHRGQKGWGPSPATTAVVRAGHQFSRLVLDRYHDRAITASDVAVYLGVRMKHIPSIERTVFGRAGVE